MHACVRTSLGMCLYVCKRESACSICTILSSTQKCVSFLVLLLSFSPVPVVFLPDIDSTGRNRFECVVYDVVRGVLSSVVKYGLLQIHRITMTSCKNKTAKWCS